MAARPLLRLGSMFRAPAPPPAQPPAPEPAQPPAQAPAPAAPAQAQPAPPPAQAPAAPAPAPAPAAAPAARPAFRAVGPPPPPPSEAVRGTASVPSSPVGPRVSAPTAAAPKPPSPTSSTAIAVTSTSSVPSSPKPTLTGPSSPVPKAATESSASAFPDSRAPAKPAAQTPPPSPKPKPSAPPPSPYALPPAHLKPTAEAEKTVTIDKPKQWPTATSHQNSGIFHRDREGVSKEGQARDKPTKQLTESEDGGLKVITIAGENRGAFMEVIQSPKKEPESSNYLYKKGTAKPKKNGSGTETYSSTSSDEGSPNRKGKATQKALPMRAFMNSNVQGINNSIVYNSSCTHHDPGVHLALSRKPAAGGFHAKEYTTDQS